MTENTVSEILSDVPWKLGGLYGVATYVLALVSTGAWFYFDHMGTLIEYGLSQVSTAEKVGAVVAIFYNSQYVVGEIDRLVQATSRGFLVEPVFRAIPVVLLLLIAAVFVYAETDASDRIVALLSGASLVVGYFVPFVVVVLVFRSLAGPGFLPIGMAVVVGLLYPIVFGSVAGLVAYEVKSYQKRKGWEAPAFLRQ